MEYTKPNEMVYDLQCKGFKIIQDKKGYCFTTDSVLLANFVRCKPKDRVVEFCSGSGVVSILAYAKNRCKDYTMVELQPRLADMSNRTIMLNNLQEYIKVENTSIQNFAESNHENFDVVFCNPPYFSDARADKNMVEEIKLARHEIAMNLQDLAKSINKVLKFGGKFFIVHKAERFDEIVTTFIQNNLSIKNVVFCHPKIDKDASFVLFEGLKGGKNGLKVLPPLILNEKTGEISEQVKGIYNRNI